VRSTIWQQWADHEGTASAAGPVKIQLQSNATSNGENSMQSALKRAAPHTV
jgi:hypothetical protein